MGQDIDIQGIIDKAAVMKSAAFTSEEADVALKALAAAAAAPPLDAATLAADQSKQLLEAVEAYASSSGYEVTYFDDKVNVRRTRASSFNLGEEPPPTWTQERQVILTLVPKKPQ